MSTAIKLEINDEEINFVVTSQDHTSYINEMQPNNKVAPAYNMLMRTVLSDDKEALKKLLKIPTMTLQVFGKVMEEFIPNIRITVGKSSKSPNK